MLQLPRTAPYRICLVGAGTVAFLLIGTAQASDVADRLETARAQWRKANLQDYSYTFTWTSSNVVTNCDAYLPFRMTVRAGEIVGVRSLGSGRRSRAVPRPCYRSVSPDPIDGIFDRIEMDVQSAGESADRCVMVSYDPTYGFPSVVGNSCVLDGDYPIRIWDFRPTR